MNYRDTVANKDLNVHVRCRLGRISEEVTRAGSAQFWWFVRAHPLAPSLFLRRPLLTRYVDDELSHEHILSTNYHADGERNPSSEMMFLSLTLTTMPCSVTRLDRARVLTREHA
jgi:hypothetical protein